MPDQPEKRETVSVEDLALRTGIEPYSFSISMSSDMMRISLSFRPLRNDRGTVVVFIASFVACY